VVDFSRQVVDKMLAPKVTRAGNTSFRLPTLVHQQKQRDYGDREINPQKAGDVDRDFRRYLVVPPQEHREDRDCRQLPGRRRISTEPLG
jgi:hypothetical protein